jgi:hypothetical protein
MSEAAIRVLKDAPKFSVKPKRGKAKSKTVKVVKKAFTPARIGILGVTLFGLAVSLTHLSEGVMLIADCPAWEGWAIALTIDAMLIAVEYAMLVSTAEARKGVEKPAHALMLLCITWSMYLNALGFTHGHLDYAHADGIGLGVFVPLAIALATLVGTRLK